MSQEPVRVPMSELKETKETMTIGDWQLLFTTYKTLEGSVESVVITGNRKNISHLHFRTDGSQSNLNFVNINFDLEIAAKLVNETNKIFSN